MAPPVRLLLLAVDAADAGLISNWAEQGLLPTWRSLLDDGLVLRIENPPALYPGAVWPCFYTGVLPTRHGRYSLAQIERGGYRVRPFHARDVKREAFWEPLGRAGRRVAVVDVPKTVLTTNPQITHIADWGTHDPEHTGPLFHPAELESEVHDAVGSDPVGICDRFGAAGEHDSLRDGLLARIAKKEALIARVLDKGGWDLLIGTFSECHCAGHQLWHLHDSRHPKHDAARAAKDGDPILAVYQAIDAALGRLMVLAGPETRVLVYCSHGMGPHYDGTYLLEEALRRLEGTAAPATRRLRDLSVRLRYKLPWRRFLPRGSRRFGKALARDLEESAVARERARRRYFPVPTSEAFGGIRINLQGREREGKVAPGPEYEALCESLTADLMDFRNPDSGGPAVRAVHRTDQLFPGEYRDDFPDLLVEWRLESYIAGLASPKIGEVRAEFLGSRTGDHRSRGLLLGQGPGLPSVERATPISVVDIAPTVAAALGVTLEDCDGESIPEIADLALLEGA